MFEATRSLETRSGAPRITLPVMVLIVLFTWAISAGVTYGILSTRIEWLSQRMDTVERREQVYVERTEYDSAELGITGRLDRIERKIDALR